MVGRVLYAPFFRFARTTPIVYALVVNLGSLLFVLEFIRTSSDGRLARLYFADRLLNGLVHFVLDLIDSAASIEFGLYDFICLKEVL